MSRACSARARKDAFSLVEVTMALGVFSVGLMGLLGLIPAAVTTHRDAKVDTVLSQIKQRLAAEVMLTDGEQLQALNLFDRAFDVEGRETDSAARTVYRGRIEITSFIPPGSSVPSETLQRVVLKAVHDPTPDASILARAPASGSLLVPRAESAAAKSALP